MNETVNKFLLARDKFMPKMHLKQPEFTCNACGPFTKNIERIKKKKKKQRKRRFKIYLPKYLMEILKVWQERQHEISF